MRRKQMPAPGCQDEQFGMWSHLLLQPVEGHGLKQDGACYTTWPAQIPGSKPKAG